ncbi:MAG: GAP family protein [Deltaproteobacteria bacterium]|nr:GAP family protein [Deltaproteobacteria bacterium]
MTELLLVLVPIALVDSTSMLPIGVPVMLAMLAAPRGPTACVAFLLGIFAVYLPCGIAIALGLGAVFERLGAWLAEAWARTPGTSDLALQIAIGGALLAFGWKLAGTRQKRGERAAERSGLAPPQAFTLGAGLMIVGMPGALPYFAAVDQILRADVSATGAVLAVLWYNAVFLLPLILVPVLRLVLGARSQPFFDAVSRFSEVWGRRLIAAVLLLLGGLLVADGLGWFLGRPLFPLPPPPPG